MPGPISGVRFVHAAICAEAEAIERAAASDEDLGNALERITFLSRTVKLHTDGEEASIFPALEEKMPAVAAAYLFDHDEEDALFAELLRLGDDLKARDSVETRARFRRQTTALTEHLLPHIRKEDTLVTPLLERLFSPPEQGALIGKMLAGFSPADMANVLPWIIRSISADDREQYLRMMKGAMPPERFVGVTSWIKAGVDGAIWDDLRRRVPELPA